MSSYHTIRVLGSILLCYLLLCSIILPTWDLEMVSNPVNGIEHPVLKLKRSEVKQDFLFFVPNIKKSGKKIICLERDENT